MLMLFSCGEKETVTQSLHISLVNKTDRHLLYAIETDEKNDTIISRGLDSVSTVFYRTMEIENTGLGLDTRYYSVNVIRKTIFNITDTSKYSYYCFTLPQNMTAEDIIFVSHDFSVDNASFEKNGIDYSVLYFTDTIVDIMQKDYGMLDKFKEYYSN